MCTAYREGGAAKQAATAAAAAAAHGSNDLDEPELFVEFGEDATEEHDTWHAPVSVPRRAKSAAEPSAEVLPVGMLAAGQQISPQPPMIVSLEAAVAAATGGGGQTTGVSQGCVANGVGGGRVGGAEDGILLANVTGLPGIENNAVSRGGGVEGEGAGGKCESEVLFPGVNAPPPEGADPGQWGGSHAQHAQHTQHAEHAQHAQQANEAQDDTAHRGVKRGFEEANAPFVFGATSASRSDQERHPQHFRVRGLAELAAVSADAAYPPHLHAQYQQVQQAQQQQQEQQQQQQQQQQLTQQGVPIFPLLPSYPQPQPSYPAYSQVESQPHHSAYSYPSYAYASAQQGYPSGVSAVQGAPQQPSASSAARAYEQGYAYQVRLQQEQQQQRHQQQQQQQQQQQIHPQMQGHHW